MATTDPTNARLRDFDIPVIMPRFDLPEPPFDDSVSTGDFYSGATGRQPSHPSKND